MYISAAGFSVHIIGLYIFYSENQNDKNIYGLFLHVLADTLGSFCVLVSCFLVKNYDIQYIDPICAIIVSAMIFVSVVPLIQMSCKGLILSTPDNLYEN